MDGTEEWRPVVGYEGLYEVSNLGRVKSLPRNVKHAVSKTIFIKGRILKPSLSATGYRVVNLANEGKSRPLKIHRLVLEAFVGEPAPGDIGLHWDDDRDNNRLSNLRWGTYSDNMIDAVRNGGHWLTAKTECPRGHLLVEPNLQPSALSKGSRDCRACSQERARAWHHNRDFSASLADVLYERIMENV